MKKDSRWMVDGPNTTAGLLKKRASNEERKEQEEGERKTTKRKNKQSMKESHKPVCFKGDCV